MEITRGQRELTATLVEWYLTGELDSRIEMEEIKSEDSDIGLGATDYSSCDGRGSSGRVVSMVEQFEIDKLKARERMCKLTKIKRLMDIAWKLIDEDYKRILIMKYKKKIEVRIIADELGYSEWTVHDMKKKILNELATHLDFTVSPN